MDLEKPGDIEATAYAAALQMGNFDLGLINYSIGF